MALRKTLQEAMDEDYVVLFDANVLINAYNAPRSADPYGLQVLALLRSVPGERRFISELVKWQFLHPNVSREEMSLRRGWLSQHVIKVRPKHPAGYLKTLESLTVMPQARGDAVDGALAAYSVASKGDPNGEFAIATADGDDFCWHDKIVVIADFFRGPACQ